jgi:hypothetical protein
MIMSIYDANSSHYHSKSALALIGVSHWVADKVEAHHTQKSLKHHIAYLRGLDRHMLLDMGIDISALYETHPHIEQMELPEPDEHLGSLNLTPYTRIR